MSNCNSPPRCTRLTDTALLCGNVHCRYRCVSVCVFMCVCALPYFSSDILHGPTLQCNIVSFFCLLVHVTLYYHVIIQLQWVFHLPTLDLFFCHHTLCWTGDFLTSKIVAFGWMPCKDNQIQQKNPFFFFIFFLVTWWQQNKLLTQR